MTTDLSDDPRDKLRAALSHAYPDADDLGSAYRTECEHWFSQLTEGERWMTVKVTVAYEKGDKATAAEISSQLPPAPRCPL